LRENGAQPDSTECSQCRREHASAADRSQPGWDVLELPDRRPDPVYPDHDLRPLAGTRYGERPAVFPRSSATRTTPKRSRKAPMGTRRTPMPGSPPSTPRAPRKKPSGRNTTAAISDLLADGES